MFDDAAALLERIRLGEDSQFEMKEIALGKNGIHGPDSGSLSDELAAFANSPRSGLVLFGVNDKTREIVGIPHDRVSEVVVWLRNIVEDRIKPPLQVAIIALELPDSLGQMRALVKVEISRSLFVHKSANGYFHRVGDAKKEMPYEQLLRLGQQRTQSRLVLFDEQPVPGTTAASLDSALVARFSNGAQVDETTLAKLGIVIADSEGVMRATVTGVLLAASRPEQLLHTGACVEAVHYGGTRLDAADQLDARRICGPLDVQILDTYRFIVQQMVRRATKAPARIDLPQFSRRAIFEAVVNALVHRDYSVSGSRVRVFLFSDRLEIYSPGALPNTLSPDSISQRQFTRNETLASLLSRLPIEIDDFDEPLKRGRFLETRGEGVPIIISETLKLSGIAPKHEVIDDAEVKLTIPAANVQVSTPAT